MPPANPLIGLKPAPPAAHHAECCRSADRPMVPAHTPCTSCFTACRHAGRALRPPRTLPPLEHAPGPSPALVLPALAVVRTGDRHRRPRGPLARPQPPLRRPALRLWRAMCAMRQCAMHVPLGGRAACMCLVGRTEGRVPMPPGQHGAVRRLRPSLQCMAMMSECGDGGYVFVKNIS